MGLKSKIGSLWFSLDLFFAFPHSLAECLLCALESRHAYPAAGFRSLSDQRAEIGNVEHLGSTKLKFSIWFHL